MLPVVLFGLIVSHPLYSEESFEINNTFTAVDVNGKYARSYSQPLSEKDKKDIRYITETLAWGSAYQIAKKTSSLNQAGDRIRPAHPLRFLEYLFSDEKLTAAARAIRGRSLPMVWSNFWGGLKDTLHEEYRRGNLTDSDLTHFAHNIRVPVEVLKPLVHQERWRDFYDTILEYMPKPKDNDKYSF